MDAWWTNFKTYIFEARNVSDWRSILPRQKAEESFDGATGNNTTTTLSTTLSSSSKPKDYSFEYLLSQFLFSRHGSKFKRNFRFDGNLTCNVPAPPIKVSKYFYILVLDKSNICPIDL